MIKWGLSQGCKGWFNIHKIMWYTYHITKLKNKNHMITSVDKEKVLTKVNIHLWFKSLSRKWVFRRKISQHNKSHIWEVNSQYHTQWWKLKCISSKIKNKTRMFPSPLLFNIVLAVLVKAIRQQPEIREFQTGKKDAKLTLLAKNMIVFTEIPKDTTKKTTRDY